MRIARPAAKQGGFTLVELVIVLVVLGILAAVAIPRYVDLTATANATAQKVANDSIQTGFNEALAQNAATSPSNPWPTMTEIIANVQKAKLGAGAAGVCAANGFRVDTFTNTAGTTPTAASTDLVKFVGNQAGTATADSSC